MRLLLSLPFLLLMQALTMTAQPFFTSTMRRALQAVLSRRSLRLPRSSCNLDHHYSHRSLNRLLYSTSPRLLPQKTTTFNITYPPPAHDSGPNLEYDGHWVKLIKEVVEGQSSSLSPVNCTGSVAYRTCYNACDSTRWNLFRQKFDTLILKKWEAQAKHGVDPDGARFLWKLWWFDADEGADMTSLNMYVPAVSPVQMYWHSMIQVLTTIKQVCRCSWVWR